MNFREEEQKKTGQAKIMWFPSVWPDEKSMPGLTHKKALASNPTSDI